MALPTVNKGDIFYNSWGWEQTNIDFYEVVSVTKSGKTATLRKLASNDVEDEGGFMTGKTTAIAGEYRGEAFKKRVNDYDGRAYMSMDYGSLTPWDGEPKRYSSYA